MLSPVGTNLTLAPVRFSNSSRTLVKFSCSGPVQTAATSSLLAVELGQLDGRGAVLARARAVSVPLSPVVVGAAPGEGERRDAVATTAVRACA